MSVFLVVIIITISFLGSELQSSVIAESNSPEKVYLRVFLFGISLIKMTIEVARLEPENAHLYLRVNGKLVGISLTPDRTDKDSIVNYLTSPLMKAVDIKYVDICAEIGVKNGNFAAVMIAEMLRAIYCAFTSFIKSKQVLSEKHRITADGRENRLFISFFGIIRVTPANIIYSLFAAYARKLRFMRNAERKVKYDT